MITDMHAHRQKYQEITSMLESSLTAMTQMASLPQALADKIST